VPSLDALLARIAGTSLGPRGRELFINVGYLVATDLALGALGVGLTAWIVRILGPAEFGQVNLVASVAQLWVIGLLAGLHAAVTRHLAAHRDEAPVIIGTTLTVAIVAALVLIPLMFLARDWTLHIFRVDASVFAWSILLALGMVSQQIVNGTLAGLQRFRRISQYNIAAGLFYIAIVATLLVAVPNLSFRHVVAATLLRSMAFAAMGLVASRTLIGRPSRAWSKRLLSFGGYHTLAALAHFFILGSIDNLMLNAYHGPAAVGLYGAYYVAFNIFTNRVVKFVSDVLVPAAAGHDDPRRLARMALRAYGRAAWGSVPAVAVVTYVLFRIYGGTYEFRWTLAVLMSINVWLHAVSSMLGDFLVAAGVKGVRWSMYGALVTAAVNVTGNVLLIPTFDVAGAMLSSLLAFATAIAVRSVALSRLNRDGTPENQLVSP
jgi:O-antigen/teichoic acid export membrane protein